jgi:hypothetical protein
MLISTALEGKLYRSRSLVRRGNEGIIQYAEKRNDVHTAKNEYAYLVKVRPTWNGTGYPKPDFYATIYVEVDN